MNNSEQNIQKMQVHYYFNDESHSMNALVRNKAEKDLLEAIRRISEVAECEFSIESLAYDEGGLIERLLFVAIIGIGTAQFFSPAINTLVHYYLTNDEELDDLKKQKLYQEIRGLELDNNKKELELEQVFEDKQTLRHISNYYKKIESYPKIKSIGYKRMGDKEETIVPREQFKNFILIDDKTVIEDDEAEIEIISPVLKEGKYKWRGKYQGENIDFSMGDSKFKQDVIERKHTFSNGITIQASLQITITYDEFGDEKRKSFSVKKVYGIKPEGEAHWRVRPVGTKKKREEFESEHLKSLFDGLDTENE